MKELFDVIIVGAGVIGANIARKLSSYQLKTLILEKAGDVCDGISSANSAVIHSGYDPDPGTNKAKFNVLGNKMFDELCQKLDVPFKRIGSLTIAMTDNEVLTLKKMQSRAKLNNVSVRLLNHDQIMELEPNINQNVKAALFAPTAGIIDPFIFVAHNIENALDNGAILHLNEDVKKITYYDNNYLIETSLDTYTCKVVINAAGHGAYDLANQLEKLTYSITMRKGEYFLLDHCEQNLVKHVIFPLPDEKGKGILVLPTCSNNYLIGPSSEVIDKMNCATDNMALKMVKNKALSMVPNVPFGDLIRVFAGVRPTPTDHDFHIEPLKKYNSFINICGIESPGFVASPAIADYVVECLIKNILPLKKNINYIDKVKHHIVANDLTNEERNKLILENPLYGDIICQCEKISKGEIIDIMSRSDHPKTIKAIKKRCRAGFGKCQGSFCQPLVAKIISEYFHIPLNEVLYSTLNSNVAQFKAK